MDLKSILISVGMFYWSWLLGIWSFFIPKKYRMKKIEGEIVLITGAASGLGRIMAIRFAKLKARVVIWDVNEAGLKDTAKFVKRFGAQCYHYVCDISDRKLVYATADKVKADVGNVSILINNAGQYMENNYLILFKLMLFDNLVNISWLTLNYGYHNHDRP